MARSNIARLINARPSEIIFTAGGTESVNLAIFGIARAARMNTDKKTDEHGGHLIASAVEHHCVINSLEALEQEGYKTSLVPVDGNGFINMDKLKSAIRPETILISVMLANNEIGTIEPIVDISKMVARINTERGRHGLTRILLHTDACQASGFLDLDVNHLGVDLMSVNGSKIYGPKQAGFLYVRSGVKIKPLIFGGGQENGLRSGTENVAGIVGLATAFELAQKNKVKETKRLLKLRDSLINKIIKQTPNVTLNGPKQNRLPNNINFSIKGVEGEALMLYLDSYGICASTASACSTGSTEASYVLLGVGKTPKEAKSSIRFSLGKSTTQKEINYLIKLLPNLILELRKVKNIL